MDKMQNFVVGDIVTPPSPASSGTAIEVESNENFPNPSTFGAYNLVLWNKEGIPDTSNCEIVRVTSISVVNSTLTELTITRAQEGTTAKTITASWRAYLSPTKKYFDDLKTYIDNLQLTKASGSDINTGTDDAKFVTSKAIADSDLADYIRGDGWITANETWTYASATSFTIAGVDLTATFSKGTRLRFKQGGGWKYATVISSSFSTNTTVNVIPNTDYSFSNSTITDTYFSKELSPNGYPDYFNFTVSSANFTLGNGVLVARFSVFKDVCNVRFSLTFGTTTSFSGFIYLAGFPACSAPVTTLYNIEDYTTTNYVGVVLFVQTTGYMRVVKADATHARAQDITATVPMTWTNLDNIVLSATYNI